MEIFLIIFSLGISIGLSVELLAIDEKKIDWSSEGEEFPDWTPIPKDYVPRIPYYFIDKMKNFKKIYEKYENFTDEPSLEVLSKKSSFADPVLVGALINSYYQGDLNFTEVEIHGISKFSYKELRIDAANKLVDFQLANNMWEDSLNVTGNYSVFDRNSAVNASGTFLLRLYGGIVYAKSATWNYELYRYTGTMVNTLASIATKMDYPISEIQFSNIGSFTETFQRTMGRKLRDGILPIVMKEFQKSEHDILGVVNDQLDMEERMVIGSKDVQKVVQTVISAFDPVVTIPAKCRLGTSTSYITEISAGNLTNSFGEVRISAANDVMNTAIILRNDEIEGTFPPPNAQDQERFKSMRQKMGQRSKSEDKEKAKKKEKVNKRQVTVPAPTMKKYLSADDPVAFEPSVNQMSNNNNSRGESSSWSPPPPPPSSNSGANSNRSRKDSFVKQLTKSMSADKDGKDFRKMERNKK